MRFVLAGIAVDLSLMLSGRSADAMNFEIQRLTGNNTDAVVMAYGEILPGDDEKLHRFVGSLPANTNLVGILLTSPGGNLLEGVRLATTIRNTGMKTGVSGTCASACFLVFASGTVKFAFDGARIGVHSAGFEGVDNFSAQAVTTMMARKASELGVPPAIIGKMVTTAPDQIAWLTHDDLISMNVKFEDTNQATYEPGSALRPGSEAPPQVAVPLPTVSPAPAASTAPDQQVASMPAPTMSLAFLQGRTARMAYEQWFTGLSGEYKEGAEWWADHRSTAVRDHLLCDGPTNPPAWVAGCLAARVTLAPSDIRRRSESDFKAGWNSL